MTVFQSQIKIYTLNNYYVWFIKVIIAIFEYFITRSGEVQYRDDSFSKICDHVPLRDEMRNFIIYLSIINI